MSSQGGKNSTNSSGISSWFLGGQDKGSGSSFGGNSNTGGNSSNSTYGSSSNNGFGSTSKSTQDWQSGRNVNIWMPQSL